MRNKIKLVSLIPGALGLVLGWSCLGVGQDPSDGTGKKVGEKIDSAIQDFKGGLRTAGSAVKDEVNKARLAINNMSVESRVYSRIHWDRVLNGSKIEISATEDGVITLDGTVVDAKAKQRASDLASETLGVNKVVDRLAVRPATKTTEPAK